MRRVDDLDAAAGGRHSVGYAARLPALAPDISN